MQATEKCQLENGAVVPVVLGRSSIPGSGNEGNEATNENDHTGDTEPRWFKREQHANDDPQEGSADDANQEQRSDWILDSDWWRFGRFEMIS
jgi:hypothetical protein